jgi:hypothetical protein
MKVVLERTSSNCAEKLKCVVCLKLFQVGRIRSLLCDSEGLIKGDLCPECNQKSNVELRNILQIPEAIDILRPKFYHWWLKKWAILSEAAGEIEMARLESRKCKCPISKKLKIHFISND